MIRWVVALLVGLAAAWLAYHRGTQPSLADHAGRSRLVNLLLALCRAGAVALITAMILGAPAGRSRPLAPLLAVDVSASVRRAAGEDSARVWSWRQWLRDTLASVPADAPLAAVGDSLREVPRAALQQWVPADQASRIRPAVDQAAAMGRPLWLFTDGAFDDPEAVADAPPGSRVITVPTQPKADVAIADLTAPLTATAGDSVEVTVFVQAGSIAVDGGAVQLRLDGTPVATMELPPLGPQVASRLARRVPLPRGAKPVRVEAILEVASDIEPRNDTLATVVEVLDRPAAVFVSTAPDLDVREVLTVLRGTLDIPTRAYLRLAPGVWRTEGALSPVSEAEVRQRARGAGVLFVHGDTSWLADGSRSALPAARALWTPAPPAAVARAGQVARAAEWYADPPPLSPLQAALGAFPVESLPPIVLPVIPEGAGTTGFVSILTARLGKQGAPFPVVRLREVAGGREVRVAGSGFAGWARRGGRPGDAFTALWGATFDWLAAGRGDVRAARPATGAVRSGEPVLWRRGGSDSLVAVTLRSLANGSAAPSPGGGSVRRDTITFRAGATEAESSPLAPGTYAIDAPGGSSLLVVNPSREWVPRSAVRALTQAATSARSDAPRLADAGWPFLLALLLLSAEWIGRRFGGHR
jgi:hypothetical protein